MLIEINIFVGTFETYGTYVLVVTLATLDADRDKYFHWDI